MTDPMNRTPGTQPPAWPPVPTPPAASTDETQTTFTSPAPAPVYGTPAYGAPSYGAPTYGAPQYPAPVPGVAPAPVAGAPVPPPAYTPATFARPEAWAEQPQPQPAPQPQATWAAPAAQQTPAWQVATAPAAPTPKKSNGVGMGTLIAAVLGTAIIASGGSYIAATAANGNRTGADQPAAAVTQGQQNQKPQGSGNGQGQAPATTPAPTFKNDTPAVTSGDLTDVVKAVSPAVVTITAEGVTSTDVLGQTGTGTAKGSGVIFDANGLILTNHHVVSGNPSKLTVTLKDGRTLDAEIYGIDTLTDLAIVKVNETGLPTARIGDSSAIEVGQQAIAIGSPLGEFTDSVTSGIVSALHREIQVEDGSSITNLIQTDTAINPGNSGGPLLNIKGEVIGINTAVAGGSQGIGFAIPINIARPMLAQASAGQALARPWLGIRFQMITPDLKTAAGLTADNGAWIPDAQTLNNMAQGSTGQGDPNAGGTDPNAQGGVQVPTQADTQVIVAGSPAEAAGLKAGDIITSLNGAAIDGNNPLDYALSQLAPGDKASLSVLRGGNTITIEVTLGTRPSSL